MDTTATQHVEPHAGRNRKDPFLELSDDTQVLKQTISSKNNENDNASSKPLLLEVRAAISCSIVYQCILMPA